LRQDVQVEGQIPVALVYLQTTEHVRIDQATPDQRLRIRQ
jgi:hypothetical protein